MPTRPAYHRKTELSDGKKDNSKLQLAEAKDGNRWLEKIARIPSV